MNNAAVDSNIEPADCHQTEMDFAKKIFKYVG